MGHVIEPAASGRAKCRGCGRAIGKGDLRLGERFANPFAEGTEMTVWFHLWCAAYKRPEAMLQALVEHAGELAERTALEDAAQFGMAHRRLPRLDGAERASTGRAKCRSCKEPIAKGAWRLRIVYFEEGMVSPGGCVHLSCADSYFDTTDILARVRHFSPELEASDLGEIGELLEG